MKDLAERINEVNAAAHEKLAAHRTDLKNLARERQAAATAPLPLDEVLETIPAVVEAQAQKWLTEQGYALYGTSRSLASAQCAGRVEKVILPDGLAAFGAQCVANPAAAADYLAAIVKRLDYKAGPRSSERASRVMSLDAAIAAAGAEEEALVDRMLEAGLRVEHRPEVLQRRETERLQAERDAAAVTRRAGREAQINARHAEHVAQRRPGQANVVRPARTPIRSNYLAR